MIDEKGEPHVLDFGLAKALLDNDSMAVSIEGQIAGTPAYMSPEQASGVHSDIDTRTDVFSLGVILYELLTGLSPHDLSGSMLDVLHNITEGNIIRPSQINKKYDSELEAIILKALSLNPDERYASAGMLGIDIKHYLEGEPLDARVPTTLYFLRKKTIKYKKQVMITAGAMFVIFAIFFSTYNAIIRERTIRINAEKESETKGIELASKSEKLTWAELSLKVLGKDKEEAKKALDIIQDAYTSVQEQVSQLNYQLGERKPPVEVRRIDLGTGVPMSLMSLVRKPSLPQGIDSWTIETIGHCGRITRLIYSPGGNYLASASSDGTIRVWDSISGQLKHILIDANAPMLDISWYRDSKNLQGKLTADTAQQFIWDLETGRVERSDQSFSNQNWPDTSRTSWSANSESLEKTIDEVAKLLNINLQKGLQALHRPITALAYFPKRNFLAIGEHDGTIRLLDAQSGQIKQTQISAWCGSIQSMCFSPDKKILATCSESGTICLWDAQTWEPLSKFKTDRVTGSSSSFVDSISWSPDGITIARTNNRLHNIELLDSQSGEIINTIPVGDHKISAIHWSPDGSLISALTDGAVYIWDAALDSDKPLAKLSDSSGGFKGYAWKSQNQTLITTNEGRDIQIWEPRSGAQITTIKGNSGSGTTLSLSPEGKILAVCADNGFIRLWNIEEKTSTILRSQPDDFSTAKCNICAIAWSPDGTLLADGDTIGKIRIWDIRTHRSILSFASNCQFINSLIWSPDNRMLLCGGEDGTVRIWDAKNNFEDLVVLLPLRGSVGSGIAISAAGDYRGSPGIDENLVYAIKTVDGSLTIRYSDFRSRYGWINEPWQVGLYKPGEEKIYRIYVNAKSEGPYDGKTWETAFNDLQDAMSLAKPDTEIWVATGIYKPDRETGARSASFHLKNGVRILGGFSGTELNSYQRDPNKYETVLSGDLKEDDRPDFSNKGENSYHVVTAYQIDPNALLDGFTITKGNADGFERDEYRNGGGMYVTRSSPAIMHCLFKQNSAANYGGGICMANSSKPNLTGCEFTNNLAGAGGGLAMTFPWPGCKPVLFNCRFTDNRANGRTVNGQQEVDARGGGLYGSNSESTLISCVFGHNTSGIGGGICYDHSISAIVAGCQFLRNLADAGGGISNDLLSQTLISGCVFIENKARSYSGGALNNCRCSETKLTNCRFISNSARLGGGICNDSGSIATLVNSVMYGNNADKGAGIYNEGWEEIGSNRLQYSSTTLLGCDVVRNKAEDNCGGIFNGKDSQLDLKNCIVWSNSDNSGFTEPAQVKNINNGQKVILEHCCVQSWTDNLGGTGNFGNDPMFINFDVTNNKNSTADYDLQLSSGSPCINAGDKSVLPQDIFDLDGDGDKDEVIPYDLENKPRVLNGEVDIGVFESG